MFIGIEGSKKLRGLGAGTGREAKRAVCQQNNFAFIGQQNNFLLPAKSEGSVNLALDFVFCIRMP